jgi:hypothetical protein
VKVYRYAVGRGAENARNQIFSFLEQKKRGADAFNDLKVFIVDGAAIRASVYPEFVYGGNFQRYPWVPKGEIWIDNAISVEEYPYTLAHEIYEDELMRVRGLTYAVAHDSALKLEHRMRTIDSAMCSRHESLLPKVRTIDSDSIQELPLPDSIQLHGIYRLPLGNFEGADIWIVDGPTVRRTIYPDFGFSGNDKVYFFIPEGEIWIDNSISCEETMFSIAAESTERRRMNEGLSYDDAYAEALARSKSLRKKLGSESAKRPPIAIPKEGDRDSVKASNEATITVPF